MSRTDPSAPTPQWPEPGWAAWALGRRITVRLTAGGTGPSGGPALRDVVGFLESAISDPAPLWSIRRRTGEVVTVDVSRVIAAKVVPDAPLRLRSASDVDATTLEKIAAEAWQPLERESLGAWLLRAARGFTGRANSVLPLGSPGVPLDEALSTVAHWYRTRALPPTIQVPLPLRSDLDAALEAAGWQGHQDVAVMVGDVAALTMTTPSSSPPPDGTTLHIADTPAPQWLAAFRYGTSPLPPEVIPIVTMAKQPLFASLEGPGDEVYGIARAAVNGQWLGVTALEVPEAHRRRGVGRSLMTALIAHAADNQCRHVWLQVARDNAPARALYDQLGFAEHHHYIYRRLASPPG
ncbi:MAG: GNAT family N-acetyltransferase [Actinomycetes bacterium]